MSPPDVTPELALRRQMGIPDDARQVLVLAESSHWDPDWLRTSDEYFRLVRRNLDLALAELEREPRRVYSVECMFFLRLYWERCPERRAAIQTLANEGRLRLTSSGVTTADTLLPHTEAILRDLLLGQEWLRANGLVQEPRLAYFTDSFGCSPALPALLRAAGFDRTAITRVDGMLFPGTDLESARGFPRPGSTAELLLKEQQTLDFIWRAPDGPSLGAASRPAEVLCHWNAFTYGQGDMLAHRGISRMYLVPFAVADRSSRHVARRIAAYARQITPYARTPYLFCPIGFDFVPPIRGLGTLLDRYNRRYYPHTGLWAVNAGLDDYLALVDTHRDRLPVLAIDPNPYWMGFYTARPSLKRRCHDLIDDLLLAERLAVLAGDQVACEVARELDRAWWTAVTANHHDLITGTSPDRVVAVEQVPWLEEAAAAASAALARLAAPAAAPDRGAFPVGLLPASPVQPSEDVGHTALPGGVAWNRYNRAVRVETPAYALELSECTGGAILRAWQPDSGELLLDFPSNDLITYRDSGGLWRMGHEFQGGTFHEVGRASRRVIRLETKERDGGLELRCQVTLDGEPLLRRIYFAADSPFICFRVEGRAADRRTVTVGFDTQLAASHLVMDVPGGLVTRPRARIYEPTFWPLQHLLYFQAGGRGLALYLARPGAVALRQDGRLEAIALRNATRERAYRFLPLPATPATGHEREPHAFDYALAPICASQDEALALLPDALAALAATWQPTKRIALQSLAASAAQTDRPDVSVIAARPASRGDGLIVRLYTLSAAGAPVTIWLPGRPAAAAALCDARERDLAPLDVRDGAAHLDMPGTIATVRLLFSTQHPTA